MAKLQPLPPAQARALVEDHGLDPNQWFFDNESGTIRQGTTMGAPSDTSSSAGEALGATLKRSVIPALGGAAGFTAGAALAPATGGLSMAIPLVAALGSAAATGYAQNKIDPLSEEEAANLSQLRREHPYASLAGEILPGLATGRPSISGTRALIGGARNLVTRAPISQAQRVAMQTAGAGAGIGAAVEGGMQAFTDEPFNPGRILAAAGAEGMFMKPTLPALVNPHLRVNFKDTPSAPRAIEPEPDLQYRPRQPIGFLPERVPSSSKDVAAERAAKIHEAESKATIVKNARDMEYDARIIRNDENMEKYQSQIDYLEAQHTMYGYIMTDDKKQELITAIRDIQSKIRGAQASNRMLAQMKDHINQREANELQNRIDVVDTAVANGAKKLTAALNKIKGKKQKGQETITKLFQGPHQKQGVDVPTEPGSMKPTVREQLSKQYEGILGRLTKKDIEDSIELPIGARTEIELSDGSKIDISDIPKAPPPVKPVDLANEGFNPKITVAKTGLFKSITDRIASEGPLGRKVAAALNEFSIERTRQYGKLQDMRVAVSKLSKDQRNRLYNTLLEERRTHTSQFDTLADDAQVQGAYKDFRDAYRAARLEQMASGQPGYKGHKLEVDEFGMFGMLDNKIREKLTKKVDSEEYQKLRQEFVDYSMKNGMSVENAKEKFNILAGAHSTTADQANLHFGAARRAEGIMLPPSWVEKDMLKSVDKYIRRFANDRAFYETIEKNPIVHRALGFTEDAAGKPLPKDLNAASMAGNENVQIALRSMTGKTQGGKVINQLTTLVNSVIMGPLTGIQDALSTPFSLAKFVEFEDIPGLVRSLADFRDGAKRTFRKGMIQDNVTALENFATAGFDAMDKMRMMADIANKVSGRDSLEKFSRALAQTGGEYVAKVNKARALTGDTKAIKFMENLANNKNWQDLDDIELGARVARLVQGSYDFTGLPPWALEGGLTPLVRLSRWNIEMTNNFYKHVLDPAINDKNYTPLITSVLGATAGGGLIEYIREMTNNKETYIPNLSEILAADVSDSRMFGDLAYRFMAMASLAGVGGIITDMVKLPFDFYKGNLVQGYNWPTIETAKNTAITLANGGDALMNAENNPVQVLVDVADKLGNDNSQVWRVVNNQLFSRIFKEKADKLEKSKLARDKRMFDVLHGDPVTRFGDISSTRGAFDRSPVERMRKIADIDTLSQQASTLPREVQRQAIGQSRTPGEYEKMLTRASSGPVRSILPSPQEDPIKTQMFIDWMDKSRGPGAGMARYQKYLEDEQLRGAKRSLIGR